MQVSIAKLQRGLGLLRNSFGSKNLFDDEKYKFYEKLFEKAVATDIESLFNFSSTANCSTFAVYSQYCGERSGLNLRTNVRDASFPCYFVSNNEFCLGKAEKLGWLPVFFNLPVEKDPLVSALQTKVVKVLPHRISGVNQHPWTAYMDDKYDLDVSKIHRFWSNNREGWSFLISEHPFLKRGILLELAESQRQPRYFHQRRKIIRYLKNRCTDREALFFADLFATGLMLREQSNSQVISFCESWFEAVLQCGVECQIAFDVVAALQKPKWLTSFDRENVLEKSSQNRS